jgi:hypothetical protein
VLEVVSWRELESSTAFSRLVAGLRPFRTATGRANRRLGRVMRKKVMVGIGMGVRYRTLISVYAPPFLPNANQAEDVRIFNTATG